MSFKILGLSFTAIYAVFLYFLHEPQMSCSPILQLNLPYFAVLRMFITLTPDETGEETVISTSKGAISSGENWPYDFPILEGWPPGELNF